MNIPQWLHAAIDVLMPRTCSVCGKPLDADEPYVCRRCMEQLPLTHFEDIPFNAMEQLFAGKVPIERAAGLFYYEKGSSYASIIHDAKYRIMPRLGEWMATRAVAQMRPSGFFQGIDVVVPVPLHRDKQARRGYNQSEFIARGIGQSLNIEVSLAVEASRRHSTQTRKSATERWLNTRGMYVPAPCAAQLANRHVLLVDDVVTTGSTLEACAEALRQVPSITISLFTLAVARLV